MFVRKHLKASLLSSKGEMAAETEVKEIVIKRQTGNDAYPKKFITMEFMKTLGKVVLLLSLFIYLVLFYLKDFNEIIMEQIKIHRETGSSMSDLEVLDLVKNYSVNPISNPLRRTFFHFERHKDEYVKYWRRNIG